MKQKTNEDLSNEIQELREMLTPIADTYRAVVKVGKWVGVLLGVVSLGVGIVLGLKNIFKQ